MILIKEIVLKLAAIPHLQVVGHVERRQKLVCLQVFLVLATVAQVVFQRVNILG